ncbi:hypothetical protein [Laspinema olomoucense]|uniref:hypothetical protein n=1 Tax=Laspinema olomoucense TaxID=3231600 RepID=UPI0021BA7974|nr:hypothetical protein [Laspinema sp. D3d]MCT7973680.1 hypothetical protein [Laspinema sp. D3d]
MNPQPLNRQNNYDHWICPDLGSYWQLAKVRGSDTVVLKSRQGNGQFPFSPVEGFALRHFTGNLAIAQIQRRCHQKFGDSVSETLVWELLQKLIEFGILASEEETQTDWICPDLTPYWSLAPIPDSDQILFKAIEGNLRVIFSAQEGYALACFTGEYTILDIQTRCEQQFPGQISANFIETLLDKLIELNILAQESPGGEGGSSDAEPSGGDRPQNSHQLKSCVHWINHADGHWILRNSEDFTFLQMSDSDKVIIDQLGRRSPASIIEEFCITPQELKNLLRLLTTSAMLEGTTLPTPPRGKFNPMQLLYFRIPLFNPDPWLTRHIDGIRWIWTKPFAVILFLCLAASAVLGIRQREIILYTGQQLMEANGPALIIPFALLSMLVVAFHELGHAFTLKNFGGVVPNMGLLLMMFMPAAYTNTTDSYCLSRFKRVLVVGAGLLVQFAIWAGALWFWNWTNPSSWLHTASYLLMVAALVTVAINLNPMAKFDGYYLAVALTGINNLRTRSFALYANLLRGKPLKEKAGDILILAVYAPLSLAYIYFVFGFLFARIADWSLSKIPTTAILMLIIWLVYFFFPRNKS